jgi:acetylornithine deacetylase/succinyl-diaminopimelate desuccinylase-like protein
MNRPSNDMTAQSAAILSWLRHRQDAMAALLADLVAIPTENPPGKNYRVCVDFLESHLRQVVLIVSAWDRALREMLPLILPRV